MSKKEMLTDGAAKDTDTLAFDQQQPTQDMIHIDNTYMLPQQYITREILPHPLIPPLKECRIIEGGKKFLE